MIRALPAAYAAALVLPALPFRRPGLSLISCSHGDVPRRMGFFSGNRIEVAPVQSRLRAVLIWPEAVTSLMPSNARRVLEMGVFIGLCQPLGPGGWARASRVERRSQS
jgi:hypothetical protein